MIPDRRGAAGYFLQDRTMANIRVSCPTCKAELEIDAQYVGQEVECGSCLQVFVAQDPAAAPPPSK